MDLDRLKAEYNFVVEIDSPIETGVWAIWRALYEYLQENVADWTLAEHLKENGTRQPLLCANIPEEQHILIKLKYL